MTIPVISWAGTAADIYMIVRGLLAPRSDPYFVALPLYQSHESQVAEKVTAVFKTRPDFFVPNWESDSATPICNIINMEGKPENCRRFTLNIVILREITELHVLPVYQNAQISRLNLTHPFSAP